MSTFCAVDMALQDLSCKRSPRISPFFSLILMFVHVVESYPLYRLLSGVFICLQLVLGVLHLGSSLCSSCLVDQLPLPLTSGSKAWVAVPGNLRDLCVLWFLEGFYFLFLFLFFKTVSLYP